MHRGASYADPLRCISSEQQRNEIGRIFVEPAWKAGRIGDKTGNRVHHLGLRIAPHGWASGEAKIQHAPVRPAVRGGSGGSSAVVVSGGVQISTAKTGRIIDALMTGQLTAEEAKAKLGVPPPKKEELLGPTPKQQQIRKAASLFKGVEDLLRVVNAEPHAPRRRAQVAQRTPPPMRGSLSLACRHLSRAL